MSITLNVSDGTEWIIRREGESFIVTMDGDIDYIFNVEDMTNLRNALDVFVTGRDKTVLMPQADSPAWFAGHPPGARGIPNPE